MSKIGDSIQEKCMAFGDRIIKLNDFLLEEAARKINNESQTTYQKHQAFRVPVYLKSVANLANQLLRSGTSIGANNAEATSAISRADYRSKSYIALKEARESLYWLEMLHINKYLTDAQHSSLYSDCEELIRLLSHRCKILDKDKDKK